MLEGKVVIITGAASGIGRTTAFTVASNRAKGIVLVDINVKNAEKTADKINNKTESKCIVLKADVVNEKEVKNVFNETIDNFDTVDVLINSAGISNTIDLNDITMEQWDRTMDINLKGTFIFCREALKIMKKNRSGKIVNIASQAGRIGGLIVGPDYPASKAGVICLTKTLAKNAASFNINVNSVAPGLIETEMTKKYNYDPETIPLKRIGTSEEVADVILFLASNLSRYITGACIDVNGGMTMI